MPSPCDDYQESRQTGILQIEIGDFESKEFYLTKRHDKDKFSHPVMVSPFLVNGPNSEGATVQFAMAHSGAESGFIEIFLMEVYLSEIKQNP